MRQPATKPSISVLIWEICKALETSKDVDVVRTLLQAAATLFKLPRAGIELPVQQLTTAALQPLREKLSALQGAIQAAVNVNEEVDALVQELQQQYEAYAQCLLTVVAPDWLPCLCKEDRSSLFDFFFLETPASTALSVLVRHLSQVVPVLESSQQDPKTFISAVASETAAELLCHRFAQPGSSGIRELLLDVVGNAQSTSGRSQPAAAHGREYSGTWRRMKPNTDQIAGYLVSLPDRLASARAEVTPANFFSHVLQQLFFTLADPHLHWNDTLDRPQAVEFCALVVQRLVTRAHAHEVTELLVTLTQALHTSESSPRHQDQPSLCKSLGPSPVSSMAEVTKSIVSSSAYAKSVRHSLAEVLLKAAESAGAVEKLLESVLMVVSSADGSDGRRRAVELFKILVNAELFDQPGVRYHMTEKLLLQRTLPLAALETLLGFVSDMDPILLAPMTLQLAQFWGDEHAIQRVRVSRQAYITTAIVWLLQRLSKLELEGTPDLVSSLLQGISKRLGSPLKAVRRQAMHVGHTFSLIFDPTQPLFEDEAPFTLGPEELWPGAIPPAVPPAVPSAVPPAVTSSHVDPASQDARVGSSKEVDHSIMNGNTPVEATSAAAQSVDEESPSVDPAAAFAPAATVHGFGDPDDEAELWADDDDDEDGTGGAWSEHGTESDSDDELQPYDLNEDDELDEWEKSDALPSLRNIAAALRKQEDVEAVLAALRKVEIVVRANPDELPVLAGEVGRSLLHCRVPEWAETEADEQGNDRPELQRVKGLVALFTQAPKEAGKALIPEVYSPHLDMVQRLTIMDVLCSAAQELAVPPSAPRLTFQNKLPQVLPASTTHQPSHSGRGRDSMLEWDSRPEWDSRLSTPSTSLTGAPSTSGAGSTSTGAISSSKTRVWGHASLRKRGEAPRPTWRNKLVEVVMDWTVALVREVDVKKHGVDMFGRDSMLLGRLLTTLGTFAECCINTPVINPLASVVLELIQAPEVYKHAEPFVRRSALLAASQVMASVSTKNLTDDSDLLMLERLSKANTWAAEIAESDPDPTSCCLAASCCQLYHMAVSQALISHEPQTTFTLPIGQKSMKAADIVLPLQQLSL